jgi:hypothetical protein
MPVDGINRYNESTLHQQLKRWVAPPGSLFEVAVDGFVIDVVTDDQRLIEVQTASFGHMRRKLAALLDDHPMTIVYPVAEKRWLVKLTAEGEHIERRKSPRRGHMAHLFSELVYLPDTLTHPNLSLMVVMIHDEEIRVDDGKGSWRRKRMSIRDRHLLEVIATQTFATPADLLQLLPPDLPPAFTTADLAAGLKQPRRIAQRMAYCLHRLELIQRQGKKGRAYLYALSS